MDQKLIIVGNWKMNKTAREAADYVERLGAQSEALSVRVLLAVPYTAIYASATQARPFGILIGAQNLHHEKEGAFTGEVSALMLKEAGASFVLIGHSERRQLFKENDALINRKLVRALQDDLMPILCVGETLEERKAHKTKEVLSRQIELALSTVSYEQATDLVIAYEPVWAIGTGLVATPEQVNEAHSFCRAALTSLWNKKQSRQIPIVYGGSVTPEHVTAIVKEPEVDGVLVGGASLDVALFATIIKNCEGIR